MAHYPGHFVRTSQVPPIPSKRAKGASKEATVTKRQRFLDRFLKATVKSSTLVCSDILEGFLKLEDPKAFASFRKTIDKTKKPDILPEMYSPQGVIHCDADNDYDYIRRLNDYVCNSEVLRNRLCSQTSSLSHAIESVANCLTAVSDSFRQLAQLQQSFSEMSTAMEVYTSVAESLTNWVGYEHLKAAHVNEFLGEYLNYHSSELGPIKDLIRERENHLANFTKTEAKLNARKEKLWHQGDVNKWEMSSADIGSDPASLFANKKVAMSKMLVSATMQVRSLKDRFAFYNVQVRTESRRVFKLGVGNDLENFSEFSKKEAAHCTSLHVAWTQLVARLTDLKFEEDNRQPS
jgi:hypothetical protein